MNEIPKVTRVEHLGEHCLRLQFDDGLVREIDFTHQLDGEIFAPLREEACFALVTVDPLTHTVTWSNEIDIDPEVLHGDADPNAGEPLDVLAEYRVGERA